MRMIRSPISIRTKPAKNPAPRTAVPSVPSKKYATHSSPVMINEFKSLANEGMLIPWQIGMDGGHGIDFLTLGNKVALAVSPPSQGNPMKPIQDLDGDLWNIGETQVITSRDQLIKKLDITAEIAGKGLNMRASSQFNSSTYGMVEETSSIVLVRSFRAKAYEQYIAEFNNPTAIKIAHTDLKRFRKEYGDGYIKGRVRGGSLFYTLTITTKDKVQQSYLAFKLAASANMAMAKVSARFGLAQTINEINQHSSVIMNSIKMGGGISSNNNPPTATVEKIKTTDELIDMIDKHDKDIKTKSIGLFAFVAPYSSAEFASNVRKPIFIDKDIYVTALNNYYSLLNRCEPLLFDIQSIKKKREMYFNPPDNSLLDQWENYLSDKISLLKENIEKAKKGEGNCPNIEDDLKKQNINLPENINDVYSKLLGDKWHIREGTTGEPLPWYGLWTRLDPTIKENLAKDHNFTGRWWFDPNLQDPPNPDKDSPVEANLRISLDGSQIRVERENTKGGGPKFFTYRGILKNESVQDGKYNSNNREISGDWKTVKKIK